MRLEETVETLAKQHIQLERACEYEKEKESRNKIGLESPTIASQENPFVPAVDQNAEGSEDEQDEFFDAMSEHPEAFGIVVEASPRHETYSNYEDEESLNDTSSLVSGESVPEYVIKSAISKDIIEEHDIKLQRSFSERALASQVAEINHRRAQSQDLKGNFAHVSYASFVNVIMQYGDLFGPYGDGPM